MTGARRSVSTSKLVRLCLIAAVALTAMTFSGLGASRSQENVDDIQPLSDRLVVDSPYTLEMTGVSPAEWDPIMVEAPYAFEMSGVGPIVDREPVAVDAPFALEMTGLGEPEPWEPVVVDSPFALEMTGMGDG